MNLTAFDVHLTNTSNVCLEISTNSDFSWINYSECINNTDRAIFYQLPLLPNNTYYFRIKVYNESYNLTDTTSGFFVTGNIIPKKPDINPVISHGIRPSITYVPSINKYVIIYQAVNSATGSLLDQLRIAISNDGVTWVNDSLFLSSSGVRGQGDLVYDNGTLYYLYWNTNDETIKVASCSGACLTVENITNPSYWTFHGTVISHGEVPWTSVHVYAPSVLKDENMTPVKTENGEYVVYVTGWDYGIICTIGFYTTTDLTNASAYTNATPLFSHNGAYGDPELASVSGKADDSAVTVANVIYYNGTYIMFYQGWDGTRVGGAKRAHEVIMVAVSDKWWGDFIRLGIVVNTDKTYDALASANPKFVKVGNEFRIYYYGVPSDAQTTMDGDICYATVNLTNITIENVPIQRIPKITLVNFIIYNGKSFEFKWDGFLVDYITLYIDGKMIGNYTQNTIDLSWLSRGRTHEITIKGINIDNGATENLSVIIYAPFNKPYLDPSMKLNNFIYPNGTIAWSRTPTENDSPVDAVFKPSVTRLNVSVGYFNPSAYKNGSLVMYFKASSSQNQTFNVTIPLNTSLTYDVYINGLPCLSNQSTDDSGNLTLNLPTYTKETEYQILVAEKMPYPSGQLPPTPPEEEITIEEILIFVGIAVGLIAVVAGAIYLAKRTKAKTLARMESEFRFFRRLK